MLLWVKAPQICIWGGKVKRYVLSLYFIVLLLVLTVSCSNGVGEKEEPKVQPEEEALQGEAISVTNGMTTDLSLLEKEEELFFSIENGKDSTMNLTGATLDSHSLFVIERQETSDSKDVSRDLSSLVSYYMAEDVFVVLPQDDGKISFSGANIGIETSGSFKIKRLGSNAELKHTKNNDQFFQYDVEETDKNYEKLGYPEYLWPTTLNYYVLDLNSTEWKKYKDQDIAIFQATTKYSKNYGESGAYNYFGLIDTNSITFDDSPAIKGLYSLKDRDYLFLYSFGRRGSSSGDIKFETYFLLPGELKEGGADYSKYVIKDIPFALVLRDEDGFSTDKNYLVTLSNVADMNVLSNFASPFASDCNVKVGENNGEDSGGRGYIRSITKNPDGTLNAEVYMTRVSEDFMVKLNVGDRYGLSQLGEVESLGTISFAKTNESTWVSDNYIDLNDTSKHEINLEGGKSSIILWRVPENDTNKYKLNFTVEGGNGGVGFSQRGSDERWISGGGGSLSSEFSYTLYRTEDTWSNEYFPVGFQTFYNAEGTAKITWWVEKVNN